MHIHFGFVSICLSEENCSPAGSVTFHSIKELQPAKQRARILRTARRNLENTLRIMWFLGAHDIPLYRISATMIPLATHAATDGWAWWEAPELVEVGERIGAAARKGGYRLSSHLPEVCGLTSEASWHWTRKYLEYHRRLFDLLGLDETARIVMHVGGAYGEKAEALATARRLLESLGDWARRRLTLENDDRTYTVSDVCGLCRDAGLPATVDWHHHVVNPGEVRSPDELVPLIRESASAWKDRPVKVHVSSPKNDSQVRAHADFVDLEFVKPFFSILEKAGLDEVDAMVEAKQKDLALFRLRDAWSTDQELK